LNPDCYTFNRRPLQLVYSEGFQNYNNAIAWKSKSKDGSRAKKKGLMKGNWNKIKELAECRNQTHSKNFDIYEDNNNIN
jgi:putative endonuclease